MGTNYYLHRGENVCPTCGHDPTETRLHIGKSSMGWCFSLHVIESEGIYDLPDWERLWSKPGAKIIDEYGDAVSCKDMHKIITERGRPDRKWDQKPYGYDSWDEFHVRNGSEVGPEGLLRSRIGRHCSGHGAGTWDLIPGEFC